MTEPLQILLGEGRIGVGGACVDGLYVLTFSQLPDVRPIASVVEKIDDCPTLCAVGMMNVESIAVVKKFVDELHARALAGDTSPVDAFTRTAT